MNQTSNNLRNRIKELINSENLSYTQFARKIGIQGTIISHIMNGRNKPSLDVVQKILINFKNVSYEWLISGVGDMYKNEVKFVENKEVNHKNNNNQLDFPSLFDNNSYNQSEYSKENELKNNIENHEKNESPIESEKVITTEENRKPTLEVSPMDNRTKTKEENPKKEIPPKKIKKIVVFYSDQTFEEFKQEL
ncbi:MAG: helix-turn-helix transcriptional regulator [Paludibacteraceae bacterium]|nr:helix-turn-helix transcriptional regulator [Paludibacteraceae bacterium]